MPSFRSTKSSRHESKSSANRPEDPNRRYNDYLKECTRSRYPLKRLLENHLDELERRKRQWEKVSRLLENCRTVFKHAITAHQSIDKDERARTAFEQALGFIRLNSAAASAQIKIDDDFQDDFGLKDFYNYGYALAKKEDEDFFKKALRHLGNAMRKYTEVGEASREVPLSPGFEDTLKSMGDRLNEEEKKAHRHQDTFNIETVRSIKEKAKEYERQIDRILARWNSLKSELEQELGWAYDLWRKKYKENVELIWPSRN